MVDSNSNYNTPPIEKGAKKAVLHNFLIQSEKKNRKASLEEKKVDRLLFELESLIEEDKNHFKNSKASPKGALKALITDRSSIYFGLFLTLIMLCFPATFFVTHIQTPISSSHSPSKNFGLNKHSSRTLYLNDINRTFAPYTKSVSILSKHLLEQQRIISHMQELLFSLISKPPHQRKETLHHLKEYYNLNITQESQIQQTIDLLAKTPTRTPGILSKNDPVAQLLFNKHQPLKKYNRSLLGNS